MEWCSTCTSRMTVMLTLPEEEVQVVEEETDVVVKGKAVEENESCEATAIDAWQGIRSMTRFCSKIGWKWKWSDKCRKSEISLIWCISTTNNVKSCKKFNETAQTANFTDFSLTSCEYRPKWTKTIQTQTRRVRLQKFLRCNQICHMKADHFHRKSMRNQWSWPFELFHWIFCMISHCLWWIYIRLG